MDAVIYLSIDLHVCLFLLSVRSYVYTKGFRTTKHADILASARHDKSWNQTSTQTAGGERERKRKEGKGNEEMGRTLSEHIENLKNCLFSL